MREGFSFYGIQGFRVRVEKMCEIEKVDQQNFSFSESHSRESYRVENGVWNSKNKKQKGAVREEKQRINSYSFSRPGIITAYFTFPILDCSPLFPTGFGFILVLKCEHLILCIFVKSKTDFYAFLLILVWLIWLRL